MSRIRQTALRQAIAERARHACEYCRCRADYSSGLLSIEHIQPVEKGGPDTLDNLALACQMCNNYKFTHTEAMDPETRRSVPLFHPRRDRWHDHFTWSQDFTEVVGVTPTGRATVQALHLNREGLRNLRGVLHYFGKHPPEEVL